MYRTLIYIVFFVLLITGFNDSRMFNASASGKPVYNDSTGDKYEYEGQLKDNMPNGYGVANYFSGDRYAGEYIEGERHGHGTYIVANGGKYVGEWKNDKRYGQGTHTYADRSKYTGEWKNGKQQGQGTFTFSDGSTYVGEWRNGKHNGQGTQIFADGSTYVGGWKDGKWHGQGTATYVGGGNYIGEWKDGTIHGQGTFTWANGDKYAGEWKNYKHNGQGTKTWANGDKYVGKWKNDKKHGKGTQTWADGNKYAGEWKDGKEYKQEAYTSTNSDKYAEGKRERESGNRHEQPYTAVESSKGAGKTNSKSSMKWLTLLILVLIILIYNISTKRRKRYKNETAFRDYYGPVFALAAKVAKSDGAVTPDEIKEVESFIKETSKFNSKERRFAISVFTEAKDNDITVEEYLSQYTKIADPVNYRGLVCFLVALAIADGELKANELEILFVVEKSLKLPRNFVKETLRRYGWNEDNDKHTENPGLLKHHYDVLNLTESATNDDITRAYRQKVKEFHPDKISSKGLEDEFVKFASKKFIEIQAAYEAIKTTEVCSKPLVSR